MVRQSGTPQAVEEAGGIDALFCEYFDQQYELLEELEPEVVGHFDLIRMHDEGLSSALRDPQNQRENLEESREDQGPWVNPRFQSQGPSKRAGLNPTYPDISWKWHWISASLASRGDDSHGVAGVGLHLEKGIEILTQTGFSTDWQLPRGCGT